MRGRNHFCRTREGETENVKEREKESGEEEKNEETLCERENMLLPLSHERRFCESEREKEKWREEEDESPPAHRVILTCVHAGEQGGEMVLSSGIVPLFLLRRGKEETRERERKRAIGRERN